MNPPRRDAIRLDRLTPVDSRVVGEVLRAAAEGPFFDDDVFHTLFGLHRADVREIAVAWPVPLVRLETVAVAVNNAFNNLLGYPHHRDDVWAEWISVDRPTLNALFERLRGRGGERHLARM